MTTNKPPIAFTQHINDFEATEKGGKAEYYLNSDILQFQSDFQFETSEDEIPVSKEVLKRDSEAKTGHKSKLPSFDSKRKLLVKKKDQNLEPISWEGTGTTTPQIANFLPPITPQG